MHQDLTDILYSEERLRQRIQELGAEITADYAGEDVFVMSILRGAFIFMADLVRYIERPTEIDFMAVSSYGNSTTSSGKVNIVKDLSSSIEGKHVLIVEDILDSGLTLSHVIEMLQERNPKSITVATLLKKQGTQKVDVPCKYVGFECPNAFIVGYGLDYAERYRNLPYIGILAPRVYEK